MATGLLSECKMSSSDNVQIRSLSSDTLGSKAEANGRPKDRASVVTQHSDQTSLQVGGMVDTEVSKRASCNLLAMPALLQVSYATLHQLSPRQTDEYCVIFVRGCVPGVAVQNERLNQSIFCVRQISHDFPLGFITRPRTECLQSAQATIQNANMNTSHRASCRCRCLL